MIKDVIILIIILIGLFIWLGYNNIGFPNFCFELVTTLYEQF